MQCVLRKVNSFFRFGLTKIRFIGNKWRLTKEKALHRYFDFLHSLESALPESKQVYLVPGNVEYPGELFVVLSKLNSVINLDQDAIAQDGVTISGVGGAPAGLDLGGLQSQAMRAPYEYHEDEFARRLNLLWGVDVLITNVAPEQSPALSTFVKKSPVQLVICSARNDLKGMREGGSELQDLDGKCIIKVQAFNAEKNTGYVVDLVPNKLSSVNLEVDIWTWIPNETAKSREKSTTEQQGAQQPAPAKYSTLEDCIRNREARARRKSIDLDNSEIYQRNSQYGKGKHRKKLCSKLRLYKKFSAINTVRERTRKTDRSQ